MSRVHVERSALAKTKPWELAARVVYGGLVTAVIGWVAHAFGPVVGGLFLAFPSILPSTLALAAEHEGRRQAADEARGAVAGSVGLAVFGLVVWLASPVWSPAVVLGVASIGWLGVAVGVWRVWLWRGSTR